MKPRMRQTLIYGALLATALAAVLAPSPEESVEPAQEVSPAMQPNAEPLIAAPSRPASAHSPAQSSALMPEPRVALSSSPKDLFHIEPPPQAVATQAAPRVTAPPAPMAPPLPYTYMGKVIEQGQLTVFLTRNGKPYVARPGDVLDRQYRVDAIRPPVIELTYLPLEQKQILNIGTTR